MIATQLELTAVKNIDEAAVRISREMRAARAAESVEDFRAALHQARVAVARAGRLIEGLDALLVEAD